MVDEVARNLYRITLPVPSSPGQVNVYVIRSDAEILLLDTGWDYPQGYASLIAGLAEMQVEMKDLTQVVLTHSHPDHAGSLPRLVDAAPSLRVAAHRVEIEVSTHMARNPLEQAATFLLRSGAVSLGDRLARMPLLQHTTLLQSYHALAAASPLEEGDVLTVGEYSFHVVWAPGHSPGHLCLYAPQLKVLLAGDTLLPTITPHVGVTGPLGDADPLTDYLSSLDRIARLEVERVLPGHGDVFGDPGRRIQEITAHHGQRSREILDHLRGGRATAYTLASQVRWHVAEASWSQLSPLQQYLALSEVVAHLHFLQQQGRVTVETSGRTVYYAVRG